MSDEDQNEQTAELECQMIDAATALMEDYDYSREDIEGILEGTVFSR